jgi:polysaccharide biosynthesis transport protein
MSRALRRVESGGVQPVWDRPVRIVLDGDALEDDRWAGGGNGRAPRRLWDVIVHQRWLIALFTLAVVIIVAGWSLTTPPVYESTTVIKVDSERPRIVMFPELMSGEEMYNERVYDAYYGTQLELLTSRAVLGRVETALSLEEHPAFGATNRRSHHVYALVGYLWPGLAERLERRVSTDSTFWGLETHLDVSPVKRSRLIRITARVPDAELAALIPNQVATEYITMVSRERQETSDAATRWLESQLSGLRTKSEQASGTVTKFVRQNDLVPNQDGRLEYVLRQLEELNRTYTDAENDRMQKDARARMLAAADTELAAAALGSDLVRELKGEHARLERDAARARTVYGPQHPKMIELEASLDNAKQRLEAEITKGRAAVQAEARAAERRVAELGRRLDSQRATAVAQHAQGMQLQLLKKEADVGDTVYGELMKRLKELQLAAQMHVANVKVIDPAERPWGPLSPVHSRNLLLGLVGGLIGGLGLAFVREMGDETVRTPREVDALVRLPSVGVIPSIRGLRRRSLPPVDELPARAVTAVTMRWTEEMAGEAFRSIRDLVCHGRSQEAPRIILITSAQPAEGKSFIAVNLAISLAGTDQPVLLVDADLRRSSCNQAFNLDPPKIGLSSVLAHGQAPGEAIVATDIPYLDFLPAGPRPPDPAALLASERARKLFAVLRERYAWVVIDSPPVLTASDASVLSVQAEGVLLVVRAHATPVDATQLARDRLERLGANLVGVVLNDVRPARNRYFYANYG